MFSIVKHYMFTVIQGNANSFIVIYIYVYARSRVYHYRVYLCARSRACVLICVPDLYMMYLCVTYRCIHLLIQIVSIMVISFEATGLTYLVCNRRVNM